MHTVCADTKVDLLSEAVSLECLCDTKNGIWWALLDIAPG